MPNPTPGWVYILTNRGLPGVVKIGLTTRDTSARLAELLMEYGTVYPFAVASRHAVSDCGAVEAGAHRLLDAYRLPASELFRCDVMTARKAIMAAVGDVLTVQHWRRLWRCLLLRWHPSRRPAYSPYQYRSYGRWRGSSDGLYVLGLVAALAVPVVLFKPPCRHGCRSGSCGWPSYWNICTDSKVLN